MSEEVKDGFYKFLPGDVRLGPPEGLTFSPEQERRIFAAMIYAVRVSNPDGGCSLKEDVRYAFYHADLLVQELNRRNDY